MTLEILANPVGVDVCVSEDEEQASIEEIGRSCVALSLCFASFGELVRLSLHLILSSISLAGSFFAQ